jgi:hypothetical protein
MSTVNHEAARGAPDVAGVHDCCKDPKNLMRLFTDPFASVDRCLRCGRQHYRAVMSGLRIGAKG